MNFLGVMKKLECREVDIDSDQIGEITVTPGGSNLRVEDLYDGLMLTKEGHDFLDAIERC